MHEAYHTASSEVVHTPIHGGVAVYTKIPNSGIRHIGTLSGIVADKSSGKRYLLSNQHVFFPPETKGKTGFAVYQTGDSSKSIAKTAKKKEVKNPWPAPMKTKDLEALGNYNDSGLAESTVPVSFIVNNLGRQLSAVTPKKGMRIKMYGRTSKLQRGVITEPNATTIFAAGKDSKGKDLVSARKGIIYADIQTAPGDSGSLVMTEDNHVVGIHYARSKGTMFGEGGKASIIRADTISNAYNVVFSEDEAPDEPKGKEIDKTPKFTNMGELLNLKVTVGKYEFPLWMVIGAGGGTLITLLLISSAISK